MPPVLGLPPDAPPLAAVDPGPPLPPAPPAGVVADPPLLVEAVLPPGLALPPLLVAPPCAELPPSALTGASIAEAPPPFPPIPLEALVLPADADPPASGEWPSSWVLPPQLADTIVVTKLAISRSNCVVFVMSRLVGVRVYNSHRSSKTRALRRAR